MLPCVPGSSHPSRSIPNNCEEPKDITFLIVFVVLNEPVASDGMVYSIQTDNLETFNDNFQEDINSSNKINIDPELVTLIENIINNGSFNNILPTVDFIEFSNFINNDQPHTSQHLTIHSRENVFNQSHNIPKIISNSGEPNIYIENNLEETESET